MKLSNVSQEPSVIFNVDDPLHLQRVQCAIPGVYDPSTMDKELIPWIRPLGIGKHQTFSKPVKGNKVWVLKNESNYNECYYISMAEWDACAKEWIEANYDKDGELIMSKMNGSSSSQISYDTDDGIVAHIDEYKQQITPTGSILLHGNGGDVDIRDGNVFCGSNDGSYEYGVLGETLVRLLRDIGSNLQNCAGCTSGAYMTSAMSTHMTNAATLCASADKILTTRLKVN